MHHLYDDPHTGETIDRCSDAAVKDGLCQYHQPTPPEEAQREAEEANDDEATCTHSRSHVQRQP